MKFDYTDLQVYIIDQRIKSGDFILNPEWQRKYIWKRREQELLIDSVLKGISLPYIYMTISDSTKRNVTFNVIDGQQRLTTIHLFYNNDFPIMLDKVKTYYDTLPKDIQKAFFDYKIHICTVADYTHDDIVTLFERLNTRSTRLTKMELWNCSHYNTVLFKFLKEIERDMDHDTRSYVSTLLKKVYKQSERLRMKPLYDLVDFIYCIQHDKVTEIKSIDKQVSRFVESAGLFTEDERKKIEKKLNLASVIILTLFPDDQLKMSPYSDKTIFGSLFLAVLHLIDKYFIPQSIGLTHSLIDFSQEKLNKESLKAVERSEIVDGITEIIKKYSEKLDPKRFFDDEIRNKLWQKNGKVCAECKNEIMSIEDCSVDHKVPWSMGGKTKIENAQLLHKSCNSKKSNKLSNEYGLLYMQE